MKITKELKEIIRNKIEAKKTAYRNKYHTDCTKRYNDMLEQIENDETYKELINSINKFTEKYKDILNESSRLLGITNQLTKNLLWESDIRENNREALYKKEYEIEKEYNTLMIKLSYEKDYNSIVALLKEFDIEL